MNIHDLMLHLLDILQIKDYLQSNAGDTNRSFSRKSKNHRSLGCQSTLLMSSLGFGFAYSLRKVDRPFLTFLVRWQIWRSVLFNNNNFRYGPSHVIEFLSYRLFMTCILYGEWFKLEV